MTAEALVAVGGRSSFIAPKKGALVYGPSCLLYDYVCNFNYQGPRPAQSYALTPRAQSGGGACCMNEGAECELGIQERV